MSEAANIKETILQTVYYLTMLHEFLIESYWAIMPKFCCLLFQLSIGI